MQDLTPEGLRLLDGVAQRHGVSREAVVTLLRALAQGGGYQAQFNHPDLGGMGQWSQGGMIMVGDMFNQGLKYRVDQLCGELSTLLRNQPMFSVAPGSSQTQSQGAAGVSLFVPGPNSSSGQWWPGDLGAPSSTGAQNDLRYACFPGSRRLAIRQGDRVSVYDTGDHIVSGFSQQQGGDQSLTFTSQYGLVRVADLPLASPASVHAPEPPASGLAEAAPLPKSAPVPPDFEPTAVAAPLAAARPPEPQQSSADDILTTIERLADLRQKNILTEEEFAAKKAALLARL
ncbi:SHOCT domain-containing protein [Methylocapsa palsarum]|uniref:Short C-terminal domain-containing protein n=1 Tax=Methylocapsa palsarum TaxID=1612308 RepID=A0A1I3YE86_9HYPH|nr:SHOCT domain-containing protein [Methylocapsa palsarum]SFK30125.1 Short C-terminal domain-containing protein [Methylocapsa palsarum]